MRRVRRCAGRAVLICVGVLSSCAGTPPAPPLTVGVPHISAQVLIPAPERGAVIDAIPLPVETAAASLNLVKPDVLSLKINVKPLVDAGFFSKLNSLKPSMVPVRTIRLHYWSEDAEGRPIKLSGAVYLPAEPDGGHVSPPLLLLCHGTQVLRDRVPSRLQGAERPLALILAASGVAVALPDYPGLGDGEGFHPYCHARSLAHACVDMLRATQALLTLPSYHSFYGPAESVFVAGYSEGGYAAMATAKELELEATEKPPLRAVFPMAGPFDMSTTMRMLMLSSDPIPAPYYLPYTVLGWAPAYPELRPDAALRSEYLDAMMPVFDGRNAARVINDAIAGVQGVPSGKAVAANMLTDSLRAALADPAGSPEGRRLTEILQENDLYDWPADPSIPFYFMAGRKDELVPFENSREAYEAMKARGVRVEFRELDQDGHENGGYEAFGFMLLKIWEMMGK